MYNVLYIFVYVCHIITYIYTHFMCEREYFYFMYPFLYFQSAIKLAGKNNVKKLHTLVSIVEEKPKVDTGQNNRHNEHHIKNNFKHNHYTHNSILTPSTLNQVIE